MNPAAIPGPLARRLAQRVLFEVRTSWKASLLGGVAGFLMRAVLPLRDGWLAAATAVGCAVIFLGCLVAGQMWERRPGGRPPLDVRGLSRAAVLEGSNTVEQFGHAFGTAALALAALSFGAWLAGFLGP
jgi:hypothetical protein